MPHKSGAVEKRNKNFLNLCIVFNVSTVLIDTQMQTIYRVCDRMPYGSSDITDTCNNAVMNNLYFLPVPDFPYTLYIIQSLYFMLTLGQSQHVSTSTLTADLFSSVASYRTFCIVEGYKLLHLASFA